MSSSPARVQTLRHPSMHSIPIENTSAAANGIATNAIFTQMQMNFDYNQNPNPNGLELAGFCSPSGEFILFCSFKLLFNIFLIFSMIRTSISCIAITVQQYSVASASAIASTSISLPAVESQSTHVSGVV